MADPDISWRTHNIGALLFAATDRCIASKLEVLAAEGFGAISDAQLALFVHLDLAGTRLTALAERAGLTKQSMIELVDKAEAGGFVVRIDDPVDRRARIVRLTAAGRGVLDALHRGIAAAEEQVAAAVGDDFLERMKVELRPYALPVAPPAEAWREDNIGRLLALAARRFAREVLDAAEVEGVTEVLLTLFRMLDIQGTRLTDLAARARTTKQSMRELVDRAARLGFVARQPDPRDGRAKVIGFTPDGLVLLDRMRAGIATAEARLIDRSGADFVAALRTQLARYMVR